MTLFQQRSYDSVTVAEIAEKAGLARRTFFNHFADKREIFFIGAAAFHASVVEWLDTVEPGIKPLDAAASALTNAGIGIAEYREHAPAVRALVDPSAELTERELAEMADITAALTEGPRRRGTEPRIARMAASCAVTAYQAAWLDWGRSPEEDFTELMAKALADLRKAVRGRSR